MTKRSKYEQGMFSWVELGTTDAQSAKKFYSGLFGWTYQDNPIGPDMVYSMCKVGGADVAALYSQKGMPTFWLAYVTVSDVDATTKKVVPAGGKVHKEPFDVMDVGRMSIIVDPTGGVLALWQPKKHAGAGITQESGAIMWTELLTSDPKAAGKFYSDVLGWKTKDMPMGPGEIYTLFNIPGATYEHGEGGMMQMPPTMKGIPPFWLTYFGTDDVDGTAKKVTELGGKVVVQPMDIPNIGRFATCLDPQGAAFAVFKPNMTQR